MIIQTEFDSISDVFLLFDSGFLVDRHDGSGMVGFCLSMLCAFLLLNNFLIPIFEFVPDPNEI